MSSTIQHQNQTPSANPGGWIFADPARQAGVERRSAEIELARRSSNPGGWVFADPERQLQVFRAARSLPNSDKLDDGVLRTSTMVEGGSARGHRRQATVPTTRPIHQSATSAEPASA